MSPSAAAAAPAAVAVAPKVTALNASTVLTNRQSPFLKGKDLGYRTPSQGVRLAKAAAPVVCAVGKAAGRSSSSKNAGKAEPDPTSSRKSALMAVVQDIEKNFGKGSVHINVDQFSAAKVETFPSGSLTLDVALGGGMPVGRIVEIYGPESSGKTTLALHAIAEMQKTGMYAALIDAEHAFDPDYAAALGVNTGELVICQPECGEMALEVLDQLVRSNAVGLIVVDSVAALVPRAEIEGEIGDSQIGAQARLMNLALRKITSNACRANCTVVFLNQLRSKIGVVYGSSETTPGGMALRFYSSIRLDVRAIARLQGPAGESDPLGQRIRVKVKKSKVSKPYKTAEMDIFFGQGVSKEGSILDAAAASGFELVAKKGAWYSYGDIRLGQGRDKAVAFMKENPTIAEELEAGVRARLLADRDSAVSAIRAVTDSLTGSLAEDDEDLMFEAEDEGTIDGPL